jgi:hypothetical protein
MVNVRSRCHASPSPLEDSGLGAAVRTRPTRLVNLSHCIAATRPSRVGARSQAEEPRMKENARCACSRRRSCFVDGPATQFLARLACSPSGYYRFSLQACVTCDQTYSRNNTVNKTNPGLSTSLVLFVAAVGPGPHIQAERKET